MRLSIVKGDPGWKPDIELMHYIVTLDGVRIFTAEIADEELGYVRHITRHRNPLTRQVLVRRWESTGVVTIRKKE